MTAAYADLVRRLRAAADSRSTSRIDAELFMFAADAIGGLAKRLDDAMTRAHEAEGNLASLADALNVGARENGLRQVERYLDLGEMRGAVNVLAIALGSARARVAELEKQHE